VTTRPLALLTSAYATDHSLSLSHSDLSILLAHRTTHRYMPVVLTPPAPRPPAIKQPRGGPASYPHDRATAQQPAPTPTRINIAPTTSPAPGKAACSERVRERALTSVQTVEIGEAIAADGGVSSCVTRHQRRRTGAAQ